MARIAPPIHWFRRPLADARTRPTASTERCVLRASHVTQATVFSASGRRCGRIFDLSLEKHTGKVVYALMAVEGPLGLPVRIHAMPWGLLRHADGHDGYVARSSKAGMMSGPPIGREELRRIGLSEGAWQDRLAIYYNPYLGLPFT